MTYYDYRRIIAWVGSRQMKVLPDVLELGLKVVFCGTAVGSRSACAGAYYAGPGNEFWEILWRTGLTPHKLDPHEFGTIPRYRLGLTDLVKASSGSDRTIRSSDFDIAGFCSKVREFRPKVVAFNGKASARAFFGRRVDCGGPRRDERLGDTVVFVLPSTAATARRYWRDSPWHDLAAFVAE